MKVLKIALAAGLIAGSGAAVAQTATDAQCLLLSNAFAKDAKDAQAQKAAEASVYFYLGRIREQETAAQLKAQLDAASKSITQANAGTLMDGCVKALQGKLDLVQSVAAPEQPKGK